jgi:hypothetical protein
MKAPQDLDPDVHTVLEIVQHAGEILARVPLQALRAHLEQRRPGPDDPADGWYSKAIGVALAAQQFDAAQGILSAEEARIPLPPAPVEAIRPGGIPDDWTAR